MSAELLWKCVADVNQQVVFCLRTSCAALCCLALIFSGFVLPQALLHAQEPAPVEEPLPADDEVVCQLLVLDFQVDITDKNGQVIARHFRGDAIDCTKKLVDRYQTLNHAGYVSSTGVIEITEAEQRMEVERRGRRKTVKPLSSADAVLFLLDRGDAFFALEEAEAAIADDPGNLKAIVSHCLVMLEMERGEEALADAQSVLKVDPQHLQAALLSIRASELVSDTAEILAQIQAFPEKLRQEPEMQLELGIAYWQNLENEKARQVLEEMLKQRPQSALGHHYYGHVLSELGKNELAIASLERSLKLDSTLKDSSYVLADIYVLIDKPDKAIAIYSEMIANAPDDVEALLERGRIYRSIGDLEQARFDFEQAVIYAQDFTLEAEGLFLSGLVAEDTGNLEQAESLYKQAIQRDASYAPAWREQGRLSSRLDQWKPAEESLRKAVTLDPEDFLSWQYLGDVLRLTNRHEDALSAYNKALELEPGDAIVLNNRGIVHERLERFDLAVEDYEQSLERNPDDVTTRVNLGLLFKQLQEYDKADQQFAEALELNPEADPAVLAEVYLERGQLARETGQYELGIKYYTESLKHNSEQSGAYNTRGICHHFLGQYEAALDDYQKAIELKPDSPIIPINIGDSYYELQDYEKAISQYNLAIQRDAGIPLAYNQRGQAYLKQFNYMAAENDFRKALDLLPSFELARGNLGWTFQKRGEFEQAVAEYSRLLADNPNAVQAIADRADCYRQLNRAAEAMAGYKRALQLDPELLTAIIGLGELYEQTDQYQLSIQQYNQALELAPDHFWALYRKGFCYTMLGNHEQAIVIYEEALRKDPSHVNSRLFLANALRDTAQYEAALPEYIRLIEQEPGYLYGWIGRGRCYEKMKNYAAAIADYSQGLELDQEDLYLRNDRALLLASIRDPDVFDPALAIKDAEFICEATEQKNPYFLETRAIALAANGKFSEAQKIQQRALDVARAGNEFSQERLAEGNRKLQLFRQQKPFVLAEKSDSSADSSMVPQQDQQKPKSAPAAKGLNGGARRLFGTPAGPADQKSRNTKPEKRNPKQPLRLDGPTA